MIAKLEFTVVSCSKSPFGARGVVAGREVPVTLDGVIVELVTDDGVMSQTLRLIPEDDDPAELLESFAIGTAVTATYAVAK